MEEHPEITPDSIQSIERKGNDVLVTVEVPEDADKGQIEKTFDEIYQQVKLEAQTNAALLTAKESHIQDLKEVALKQANMLSNITIIAGENNTMTEHNNPGITAGAGSFINTGIQNLSNSLINLSGSVTNALNQLSPTDPQQAELKTSLTQLQAAIQAEPELSETDKADALEEVKVLAEIGSNPEKTDKESLGRRAIKGLKGAIAVLPPTATLVKAVSELVPIITKLLGL